MDTPNHLLALKVMRVSRPSLASSWQPFFTSSPSLSAHATESLLSLQGKEPMPNHPKTLRDLSHASQLLTLPSAFGAIQLGETFTSCLCVNNEAKVEVEGVFLRIEMQTATNKVLLAEVGGPDQRLRPAEVLETVVSHEMKELGQHVLACQVSYRFPSSIRDPPTGTADSTDPSLQSFRKYYKFVVTNPLNVKTKVHVPRSPVALLSRTEREKIFLEIHVQNLTQESMWFERMKFECVEGWSAVDGNISQETGKNIFSGSIAIMQPQDVRQYVYILMPTTIPSFPLVYPPGTVIPLGRLDLSWRSPFGEPGRLLTSLLTRRIPIPPAQPGPSAIPPHLQPSRPRSPQLSTSRPSSPPGSPTPFKPRPPSQQMGRPQSPALTSSSPAPPAPPLPPDLEVDLVVSSIPSAGIKLEHPFTVKLELTVSGILPMPDKARLLHLMVQHVQHSRVPPPTAPLPHESTPNLSLVTSPRDSPRPSLDMASPRPYISRSFRQEADLTESSPTMSPRKGMTFNFGPSLAHSYSEPPTATPSASASTMVPVSIEPTQSIRLPSPFSPTMKPRTVLPLGASVISIPPLQLMQPAPVTSTPAVAAPGPSIKGEARQCFECTYIPTCKGLTAVGGLRVLLLEDREVEGGDEDTLQHLPIMNAEAKILREWDTLAEVWVID
ncbi:hypothetical protein BU17DRAFT_75917 [Hysterangium stoloniferum]|nr:hypothetical protein BU17DRAFT_75917 [Hysterangium stoloniferum]